MLLREFGDTCHLTRIRSRCGEASGAQTVGSGIVPLEYPLDGALLDCDNVCGVLDR
jgi:hypothetical protein